MYGWALLLIVQSGGMAAVAATFARYAISLIGIAVPEWTIAVVTLLALTVINCLGVRSGSNTQSALMLLKLAAIAMLIIAGATVAGGSTASYGASAAWGCQCGAACPPAPWERPR
jgi:APA family basic amino acid/polyamine antiporter